MSNLIIEERTSMQTMVVKPVLGALDAVSRYEGGVPSANDYDTLVEGPIRVVNEKGEIVAIIINQATRGTKIAYEIMNGYIYPSKARQVATVGETSYVKKLDGTTSNTTQLPPHLAPLCSIGGYIDRQSRVPYAHATMLCRDHPDKWKKMQPFIRSVDEIFQQYAPRHYEVQRSVAQEIPRDWVIGNTAFSTITMNKNFSIQYHTDKNDLKEGLGVMSCLFLGQFQNGELVLPRYRIALNLKHRDVVLFNVHEIHGVVPIKGAWGKFNRITVVHYLRENLLRCGDAAYEIARGKRARHIGHLYDPEEIQLGRLRKQRALERVHAVS